MAKLAPAPEPAEPVDPNPEFVARIEQLDCDLLITPHPSVSGMWDRFGPHPTAPVIDPAACHNLAVRAGKALDARLAKEAGKAN